MEKQILQDFGEKIGGAKKDMSYWKKTRLSVDALKDLNDREADLYVTKKYVFKKPDYEKIHNDGVPIEVVYFMKKVYDAIPVKPIITRRAAQEPKAEIQEEYIETVQKIMDAVTACRTNEDCLKILPDIFIKEGWLTPPSGYYSKYSWTEKGSKNPAIAQKTAVSVIYGSETSFLYEMRKNIKRQRFLEKNTGGEIALPRGYQIRSYLYTPLDGEKTVKYCATYKGRRILELDMFETEEEALESLLKYAKEKEKTTKKLKYVPPQLTNIKRDGEEILSGRDVDGNDYLNTFRFRGGEYGNWMNEADRQVSMNMGYEALVDLASVLGIENEDISLGGELSIAFGARGSGNALAHYEPLRKVINLTKTKGAGCLAHEWWHALDDYIGTRFHIKGMASEKLNDIDRISLHGSDFPEMSALVRSMLYKTVRLSAEEVHEKEVKATGELRDRYINRMQVCLFRNNAFQNLSPEKKSELETLIDNFRENRENAEEALIKFYAEAKGRQMNRIEAQIVEDAWRWSKAAQDEKKVHHAPATEKRMTQYYQDAIDMDKRYAKNGGYWQSITEMSARAFEAYVKDRLGYKSDYLCAHADAALTIPANGATQEHKVSIAPLGEEREAINANFDKVFEALRKMEILHTRTTPVIKAKKVVEKIYPLPDDELSKKWISSLQTEDSPLQLAMYNYLRLSHEDLCSLSRIHQAGYAREKIEETVEACCAYMKELNMLKANDYEALMSMHGITKKKARRRSG